MLLKNIYKKIARIRAEKESELSFRLQNKQKKFRLLDLYLYILRIGETTVRFVAILFLDPSSSFELFYKNKAVETINVSFSKFKEYHQQVRVFSKTGGVVIVTVTVLSTLFINILTGVYKSAFAATYSWTQSDWNILSEDAGNHTSHQTGWVKYQSSDGVATGTAISLLREGD